jgi:probable HAF family extracellular repeat protein
MTINKRNLLTLFLTLAISLGLSAQNEPHKHDRYRLIDLGTFGGPQSYISLPDVSFGRVLNRRGEVVGWGDTSTPDPFPDFCWDSGCLAAHAFVGGHGPKKDLGVLPGGASSGTTWVADNGLIAGDSQNGETDPLVLGFPQIRAVLWQRNQVIDLGTLEGGYESISTSVNNHGQVVGLATNTIPDPDSMVGLGYQTRGFIWENGTMQDLGTLGGTDASALAINEHGQIIGNSYTGSEPSEICAEAGVGTLTTGAFLWDKGTMVNLGSFGGTCTFAFALNNRGQVVGGSRFAGDQVQHAFLWDRGTMIDLDTLGGNLGDALALNDRGIAAGWSTHQGDEVFHAALWSDGGARDLGTIAGDDLSIAFAVNNKNQVVGISFPSGGDLDSARAFLWEDGGPMVDLNSLVVGGSDLRLADPATINDRGEIAGNAFDADENQHAYLLVPCEENECNDEGNSNTERVSPAAHAQIIQAAVPVPHFDPRMAGIPSKLTPGASHLLRMGNAGPARRSISDICTRCCGQCTSLSVTPGTISFAAQPVGTISAAQSVSVLNTTSTFVTISNVSVDGSFVITNHCPGLIEPGQVCRIQVQFKPKQKGQATGKLTLTDSARNSPQVVSLSGIGK